MFVLDGKFKNKLTPLDRDIAQIKSDLICFNKDFSGGEDKALAAFKSKMINIKKPYQNNAM